MTIKEIIKTSAFLLKEEKIADYLGGTITQIDEESQRKIDSLKYCYDLVACEIASTFHPLKISQTVSSVEGKIKFSLLSHLPYRVYSVTDKRGVKYPFKVYPTYAQTKVDGEFIIEYSYLPETTNLTDQSEFSGTPITAQVIAYGVASEYCLVEGMVDLSAVWRRRFESSVRSLSSSQKKLTIPPRRFLC